MDVQQELEKTLPERLGDDLEQGAASLPAASGVVLLAAPGAEPYLGRTHDLRRRVRRLLRLAPPGSELRLRRAGSGFEAALALTEAARLLWPGDYRRRLRLKPPPVVKLLLDSRFPRTLVTSRLSSARARHFGPFRSRVAAERFEESLLGFFPIRRCSERLDPDPAHPGCVFGEIDLCLRPCQEAQAEGPHRAEAERLAEALDSRGATLTAELERLRDEASEKLDFEQAGRHHRRLESWRELWRSAQEPASELDRLHGAVLQPSVEAGAAELWPLAGGRLQPALRIEASTDMRRLEALLRDVRRPSGDARRREDDLCLLARWSFSSWRRGELILYDNPGRPPLRRLLLAARRQTRPAPENLPS